MTVLKVADRFEKLANLVRQEMVNAMARAMFVSAWADEEEEQGRSHGGEELMDVAPRTPPEALFAARELAHRIEVANGKSLMELLEDANQADGAENDPSELGHYMAMQSLGYGVSWFDDHKDFPMKLPHFEFYLGGPTVN